jgi:hypothetical protein
MPDLRWWLENFKESAFRLERLRSYNMPEEAEMLAAFKRGEKVQLPEDHPWPPLVKRHCSTGKIMQRARVVDQPPTEYQRFELSLTLIAWKPASKFMSTNEALYRKSSSMKWTSGCSTIAAFTSSTTMQTATSLVRSQPTTW